MLSEEWQQHAVSSISHAASMAGETWREAAYEFMRPSVTFRPSISIDGNKWCALYGENLQDGVAGFGDSPDLAMRDFDKNWSARLHSGKNEGQK